MPAVEPPGRLLGRRSGQDDVRQSRKAPEQVRLLEGPAETTLDEPPRRRTRDLLALEHHFPRLGRHHSRDHVEERRLAGAVRTDDRVDRALPHREADVIDGDEAAEGLRHAHDLEYRRAGTVRARRDRLLGAELGEARQVDLLLPVARDRQRNLDRDLGHGLSEHPPAAR